MHRQPYRVLLNTSDPDCARHGGRTGDGVRCGAAAIELALVLPLLMLVLLGVADFGRSAYSRISVTNAARAGAAYGGGTPVSPASRAAWEAGIRRAVREELETVSGFDASRMSVAITSETDGQQRGRVRVQVDYPFETLVNWALLPSSFQLRQSSVFPMTR